MPDDSIPRPTMDDVAAVAGVSQMTVSRVLRGTGYISEKVRERVTKAADELGYVNNRLAIGLRSHRSPLVAVIVPTLGNRVFTEVLSGLNETVVSHGYQPVFGVSEYSQDREEELVRDLLSWRPTGILLSGLEHSGAARAAIRASGIRVVEVMDTDGDPIDWCVGVSQSAAGRTMALHMLAKGYRRFAYLGSQGRRDLRATKRLDAFRDAIREAGAEMVCELVPSEPSSMVLGRRLTAEVLAHRDKPDAIYFSNDDLAAGGLMHCLSEGIQVPGDVALAGFNGLDFLEALPKRICTIQTPRHRIGVEAGLILGTEDDGHSDRPRAMDLGFRLIPGETC